MDKKYEITDEEMNNGISKKLYRIKALRDIPRHGVKAGDRGGWIESERNLSQSGDCWVGGKARVFENAGLSGNAVILDNAQLFGNADLQGCARAEGNAWVWGFARIGSSATVRGNARIHDHAWVYGNAEVRGNADVSEQAQIFGNACVSHLSEIRGSTHIVGKINRTPVCVTGFRYPINYAGLTPEGEPLIRIGCRIHTEQEWRSTEEELRTKHKGLNCDSIKTCVEWMLSHLREQKIC